MIAWKSLSVIWAQKSLRLTAASQCHCPCTFVTIAPLGSCFMFARLKPGPFGVNSYSTSSVPLPDLSVFYYTLFSPC